MGLKIRSIAPNIKSWHSTGHVKSNVSVIITGTSDLSNISKDDLDNIYDNYIKTLIDKNPLYMDSNKELENLACIFYNSYLKETNDLLKCLLLILSDITNVLAKSKQYYLDKMICDNNYKALEEKYKLSEEEVQKLKELVNSLQNSEKSFTQLQGSLSYKLISVKNPIYILAKFNIEHAWYHYIYGSEPGDFIDLKLLSSIKEYLMSKYPTKNHAYNHLILLLNKKFA